MTRHVLLTGAPGSGKTTLLRRVLDGLNVSMDGFYTEEVRVVGVRQGFRLVALDGSTGMLAAVDLPGPPHIGRYGVDRAALDAIATANIHRALATSDLVVIDEIGPMELCSPAFCAAVTAALDSDRRVFGTIVQRSIPFANHIKTRPDVAVIQVTPKNRALLVAHLIHQLSTTPSHEPDTE